MIVAGAAERAAAPARSTSTRSLAAQRAARRRPRRPRGDDPAFWLYSSGSTGKPKGTVHTHANAWWTAELYGKRVLGLTRERRLLLGRQAVLRLRPRQRADAFRWRSARRVLLMAERPTPDAVFKRWTGGAAARAADGVLRRADRLRRHARLARRCRRATRSRCACARRPARRCRREIGERFERALRLRRSSTASARPRCCTSSCRTGPATSATAPPASRSPGYEIELRGEDGRPVADGEIGDLYIKGPSAALMYWGNREKSRETFQGGWTKSGDKYVRDADGYYTYAGRSDDMLKVSGIYVSPFEVEATLMQHPAVLECAVIGTEDAEGLTKTKAFVVAQARRRRSSDAELKAFVKEQLARLQVPARDRVHRRAAEDGDRQDPALPPARARARRRAVSACRGREFARPRLARPRDRTSSTSGSARRARARRRSCSCTKASARSRCGRTSRARSATRTACAASSSRATATAARRRKPRDERWAPDFMHAAGARGAAGAARRGRHRAAVALRPQRRRLDRAAARGALPDARRRGRGRAAPVRRGRRRSRASSRRATPIESTRPARRGWRATTTTPTRPSAAGTTSGSRPRSAPGTSRREIATIALPGARGAGRGRRVRHAGADPRASRGACRKPACS